MARGRKSGSLYMVGLPSEGGTVPVQKKNKVRFTESRGQNKVVCAREKPRATGQTQDERAWKGSRRPVRGICGMGAQEALQPSCLEDSGSEEPDVPGSGSVRLQWEPVGTEDESGADFAVTDVLEFGRASTGLSVV
ncbi:unnamed protein product [Cuscuta campestris]|uniref:Uncharacterized protein n=1 Tax=Cuscuta campestris TaxID=132261 RepID=A0A484L276_9ASTE|nr:unnamed protein product [Cuscuta campestris]